MQRIELSSFDSLLRHYFISVPRYLDMTQELVAKLRAQLETKVGVLNIAKTAYYLTSICSRNSLIPTKRNNFSYQGIPGEI